MTLTWECDTEEETAMYIDRRRDARLPQERDVRISEPFSGRCFEGVTLDISSTGMRLRMTPDCRLRAGRLINLHIGLNASGWSLANRRNNVTARVVWVQEKEVFDTGFIVAGIELLVSVNATAA